MSDLESGLKEAVESARRPKPHLVESTWVERPMTAPEVIAGLAALRDKALALHGNANDLGVLLAGGKSPEPQEPELEDPRTIFDEMGQWMVRLTHVLNAIEHEVGRSYGACR